MKTETIKTILTTAQTKIEKHGDRELFVAGSFPKALLNEDGTITDIEDVAREMGLAVHEHDEDEADVILAVGFI